MARRQLLVYGGFPHKLCRQYITPYNHVRSPELGMFVFGASLSASLSLYRKYRRRFTGVAASNPTPPTTQSNPPAPRVARRLPECPFAIDHF